MDPMYEAVSLYHRKKYIECTEICSRLLEEQPLDQSIWTLKLKSLTKTVCVDDLESEELPEGDFLDDSRVSTAPRPGTSIKTANNNIGSSRPRTSTGRPLSGIARPGTQTRPGTTLDRLKTSRPYTSQSARAVRLGTAAMLNQKDGPFIQVSRLNINRYSKEPNIAKPLFEYLFYYEGDVRNAMELAVQATQHSQFKDWWWKVQLAKCYTALNLIRDAEEQLRSALKQQTHIETFIRLARIYIRLDQPLSAIDICKDALKVFPTDTSIQIEMARLYESFGDIAMSVKLYRSTVIEDAMNIEGIACIGLHHFYNNQPEMALRYYRRVLALGVHSAELYNNIGLCCLYSQQLDLTLSCFQRALDLAIDTSVKAEVWYNLSHVSIGAGDLEVAMHCLSLCLSMEPNHAAALNNLGVLHQRLGRNNLAKAYLTTANQLSPELHECKHNLEILLQHN